METVWRNSEFGSGPGAGITTPQLRQVRFLNFDSGSGSTTHLARFASGDTKEVVPLAGNEFIWKNSVAGDTGTWDTDANWIAEYYPDNALARVVFGEDALDANVSVTTGTDTDFDLNRITFRDTADFDVTIDSTGANTLTFDNDGSADPQIKVNSGEDGDYSIGSDVVLKDDADVGSRRGRLIDPLGRHQRIGQRDRLGQERRGHG